ncbi:hypothetical protein EJB05_14844, partial [Eragrostis curvula]
PGLPSHSGLKLYYVPERGGFLWMDRAVTSCHLPLQTVEHTADKGDFQPRHHVYAIDHYSSPGLVFDGQNRAVTTVNKTPTLEPLLVLE